MGYLEIESQEKIIWQFFLTKPVQWTEWLENGGLAHNLPLTAHPDKTFYSLGFVLGFKCPEFKKSLIPLGYDLWTLDLGLPIPLQPLIVFKRLWEYQGTVWATLAGCNAPQPRSKCWRRPEELQPNKTSAASLYSGLCIYNILWQWVFDFLAAKKQL